MNDPAAPPSGKRPRRKPVPVQPIVPMTDAWPQGQIAVDAFTSTTDIGADMVQQAGDVAEATVETVSEAAPDHVAPAPEASPIPVPMLEAAMSPAVDSDAATAEPEMPAPLQEGYQTMATVMTPGETAAFSQEKLQSAFGDMGARFKTSLEKSSKMGEEMADLAKGNVEAVVASARVAAKGSESLGQDAAEYTKKSFESAVAAMKSMASVKSPTELFQLQSDFMKASFDSAVAEASKFSESMMKLAGDVAQPLSSRYAVAADKIKSTAL